MNDGDYTYFWWKKLLKKHSSPWRRALVRLFWINVILVIIIFACSPTIIFDWRRKHFAEYVKKRAKPEDLRMWATNLFSLAATNEFDSVRVRSPHPVFPTYEYGPTIYVFRADEKDPAHVVVFYGSAVEGHWGIEIGPTNRPTPQSYHQHEYAQWAPGIFFFRKP